MTDEPAGRVPAQAEGDAAFGLDRLTEEILPALVARLRASRLGELEVRSDGWRVRLRRDSRTARRPARPSLDAVESAEAEDDQPDGLARSPAVGYFSPAPQLAVGRSVQAGDPLGSVDVLGVAQEVTAPTSGIVSAVHAEHGQAVEYGQALAEIDPMTAAPGAAGDDEMAIVIAVEEVAVTAPPPAGP